MTTRRELITLLGGATAGLPVVPHTQQPSMPVIGFLGSTTAKQRAPLMGAFLEGLSEAEIVVGRDVTIEYRWAEGQYDRLPALAASLVQRQVSVIAALTTLLGRSKGCHRGRQDDKLTRSTRVCSSVRAYPNFPAQT